MSITISMVPREFHYLEVENIKKWLKPAVDRSSGRWEFVDLLADLSTGRQQLWIAFADEMNVRGMVTTLIRPYPRGNVVEIVFAGGTGHEEWLPMFFEVIKRYAADLGCIGIEGVARKGFAKVFEQAGYGKPRSVYEYIF